MAETKQQKLAREMTHRESYSQESPQWKRYFESSERNNPPIGLEQPMITPLDLLGPAHVKGALTLAKSAAKGYSKLAAEAVARAVEGGSPLTALAQPAFVVKPKGGNWLSGSVEDALRGLKRADSPEQAADWVRAMYANVSPDAMKETMGRNGTINSWVDKQLTNYVKNQMATPEDPVRALAERGVLHFDPAQDSVMRRTARAVANRERGNVSQGGTQSTRLGQSPLAQSWEMLSDSEVTPGTYRSLMPSAMKKDNPDNLRDLGGEFAVANPEASAYQFGSWSDNGGNRVLGFPHLIDELSNAINPASGLPQHLLFPADRLGKVSVPQAVERVSQINAWRAAQKAEANRAIAEKASMLRAYEDGSMPNPKGLRWVELKANGQHDTSMATTTEEYNNTGAVRQALADQLKYEGDTMGHCVGGYCDDVLSGRTRIMSLRDAKGEPHVTVEVDPGKKLTEADLPDSIRDHLADMDVPQPEFEAYVQKYIADREVPPRIKQIKGKGNKKPNDEYLPFVQDFVRNNPLGGQWADVGDLQNAGLRQHPTTPNKLITDAEYDIWKAGDPTDFARGGSVELPPKDRAPITGGVRGNSDNPWSWLLAEDLAE